MTCIEKYMKEHPWVSERRVIKNYCPMKSGGIAIEYPDNCVADYSICAACWAREVPGTEAKPTLKETLEALQKTVESVSATVGGVKTVVEHLSAEELLTQLAEEAGELVQAALKLRRALTGVNPTPTPASKALTNLMEEIADLDNSLHVVGEKLSIDWGTVSDISAQKMERWAKRLEVHHG